MAAIATYVQGVVAEEAIQPAGIYLYDLSSGTERAIAAGPDYAFGPPQISGQYVIWTEGPTGMADLRLHDLSSGTTRSIVTGRRIHTVDIDGDRIVWFELSGNPDNPWESAIYLYEVSVGEIRRLATVPLVYAGPRIQGNHVAWSDYNQGKGDVYVYDLSTGKQQKVTSGGDARKHIAVSGNYVVWCSHDFSTKQWLFNLYDLKARAERTVPASKSNYDEFDIQGDQIVWRGHPDIYLTDISTGEERRLVEDKADDQYPVIDGSRVVWQSRIWDDKIHGNWDLYLYDLGTQARQLLTKNTGNQVRSDIGGRYVVWMIESQRYP